MLCPHIRKVRVDKTIEVNAADDSFSVFFYKAPKCLEKQRFCLELGLPIDKTQLTTCLTQQIAGTGESRWREKQPSLH